MKITVVGSTTICIGLENGTVIQIVTLDAVSYEIVENAAFDCSDVAVEVSRGIGNPMRIPEQLGGNGERGAVRVTDGDQLIAIMDWARSPSKWLDGQKREESPL